MIMEESFEEKVSAFIREWKLLEPGDKVLVAVSGGKDSMALLYFLSKNAPRFQIEVTAANLDHRLRGNSGKLEAEMIAAFCRKNGIPFYRGSRDVMKVFNLEKKFSLEQAARKVRYNFLEEAREYFGANKIAVAHHLDDLVETILMRLVRGTGISGITGMKPLNRNIIRPLLSVGVQEVLNYVTINMIPFSEDPTNRSEVFDRNYLRLKVIPLLRELNPGYDKAIWRFFENCLGSNTIIEDSIRDLRSSTVHDRGAYYLKADLMRKKPWPYIAEFVRSVVSFLASDSYPPSQERIKVFKTCLYSSSRSWTVEFKEDLKSSRYGDYVFFYSNKLFEEYNAQQFEIGSFPFEAKTNFGTIRLAVSTEMPENIDGRFLSCASFDSLNFPLRLRSVRMDDEIAPFGMNGKKKIGKIIKERGMLGFVRKILVLEDRCSQILWVPGIVTGEMCRIAGDHGRFAVFSLERR